MWKNKDIGWRGGGGLSRRKKRQQSDINPASLALLALLMFAFSLFFVPHTLPTDAVTSKRKREKKITAARGGLCQHQRSITRLDARAQSGKLLPPMAERTGAHSLGSLYYCCCSVSRPLGIRLQQNYYLFPSHVKYNAVILFFKEGPVKFREMGQRRYPWTWNSRPA